jgi:hypothetical protein
MTAIAGLRDTTDLPLSRDLWLARLTAPHRGNEPESGLTMGQ